MMRAPAFIGRKNELERLSALHKQKTPSLVVVKGRRRVGKSRLINFFATQHAERRLWDFAGLAPEDGMDDQSQRDHFARQLATHVKSPPFTFQDWTDAFEHLSGHIQSGDIVLFDEISWMGLKDPTFIPKLKAWWDKQQRPIMVVFCGSVSTWIEENILKSTAFFGRINLIMALEPLPIPDANQLLRASGFQGSDYDTYKLLSILGGIPWYLEQITPGQTVDDLIKQLCFEKDSLLVHEFGRIFHDLLRGRSTRNPASFLPLPLSSALQKGLHTSVCAPFCALNTTPNSAKFTEFLVDRPLRGQGTAYKKILDSLKDGMKTLADVRKITGLPHSGRLSALMEHLIIAGFVQKQTLWSFKTQKPLKQSLYRICDPYMRFYLKVIEPQRHKIDLGGFQETTLSSLPGFEAHIGLQLEQLLLQNRSILLKAIGINPTDIIASGPFRQSKNATKAGCQIDYLIQTTTKNLFLCEFKFKRRELGVDVISQVQDKVNALKVPRGFATIPVLFHIGGVSANLATREYFYRIIDIADFL